MSQRGEFASFVPIIAYGLRGDGDAALQVMLREARPSLRPTAAMHWWLS